MIDISGFVSIEETIIVAKLTLNGFINFSAMDRDAFGRIDTQSDLVTPDLNDCDPDLIIDDDRLV